jgi:hypothetical protein
MNRKLAAPLAVMVALMVWRTSDANPFHPSYPFPPDPAVQASDLPVDQLIAKSNAARGGEPKLKAIQSVKMTGDWVIREDDPAPITVTIAPGRYLRRIEQGSGRTQIKAVDGPTTWEITPQNSKPAAMTAKDAARFRHLADPQGPLVNAQAKGNKVEVVGKMPWRTMQVYKLKVTFRDGGVTYIYLDAKSFLPVRTVSKIYDQAGEEINIEFVYQEFRDVDGVKWPYVEKASAPEANFTQTITWKKIETGKTALDPAVFKAPKG